MIFGHLYHAIHAYSAHTVKKYMHIVKYRTNTKQ